MALQTTMLESKGTLRRPKIGREAQSGGVTQEPFRIMATNVPCSVQPASPGAIALYAQRQTSVSTTIYLVKDVGAHINDHWDATDRKGNVTRYLIKGQCQPVLRGRLWMMAAEQIL